MNTCNNIIAADIVGNYSICPNNYSVAYLHITYNLGSSKDDYIIANNRNKWFSFSANLTDGDSLKNQAIASYYSWSIDSHSPVVRKAKSLSYFRSYSQVYSNFSTFPSVSVVQYEIQEFQEAPFSLQVRQQTEPKYQIKLWGEKEPLKIPPEQEASFYSRRI